LAAGRLSGQSELIVMARVLFIAIGAAALLAAPWFSDMAFVNAMVLVLIAALYAMGYNLLWGQAGLISFGHATYFALGASATIMMMDAIDRGFAFPTPLLPVVGGLAGFLIGIVAGWFATIRTGVYFAMITVAITELVRAVVQRWDSVFGGEAGISSVRTAWGPFGLQTLTDVYYFTLVWTIIGILLLWGLQRSPLGTVIRGIREQEERVRFLGYDTHTLKTVVFAISAGFSGMAGGLLAFSNESTNVALFEGTYSTAVLVNTVIGGASVFFGPAVGATLTTLFGYYVANLTFYWLLYMGILFIIIVVFAPRGITGMAVDAYRRVRAGNSLPYALIARRTFGGLSLALGTVLTVEIIGAVVTPAYSAAARSSGVLWPPVPVLGLSWYPASPLTLGTITGLFLIGGLLMRDTLPILRHNSARLLSGLAFKGGDEQ
jgi:branched-chain amino acid transport system permease protein